MISKINLLPGDYYTQRNNKISPLVACMPTARVMYYRGNGIKYVNPSEYDDDDYLMHILRTPEAWDFAKQKYPEIVKAGYPPNEIHGMYHSWLDPVVVGRRVSDFRTDLTWGDYICRILDGQVIMTSGRFGSLDGHAVVMIGVVSSSLGPCLVLADPWGDYRTGYEKRGGYAINMAEKDFADCIKPTNSKGKWGHVLI